MPPSPPPISLSLSSGCTCKANYVFRPQQQLTTQSGSCFLLYNKKKISQFGGSDEARARAYPAPTSHFRHLSPFEHCDLKGEGGYIFFQPRITVTQVSALHFMIKDNNFQPVGTVALTHPLKSLFNFFKKEILTEKSCKGFFNTAKQPNYSGYPLSKKPKTPLKILSPLREVPSGFSLETPPAPQEFDYKVFCFLSFFYFSHLLWPEELPTKDTCHS